MTPRDITSCGKQQRNNNANMIGPFVGGFFNFILLTGPIRWPVHWRLHRRRVATVDFETLQR